MAPQKALPIRLSAAFLLIFLLSPFGSNDIFSASKKQTLATVAQADAQNQSGNSIKLDLTVPVNHKKQKEPDHNQDLARHKRHADEDRHEHHHHHFDKVKTRKKFINIISSFFLKIFIIISYFSILLCSYMSICH